MICISIATFLISTLFSDDSSEDVIKTDDDDFIRIDTGALNNSEVVKGTGTNQLYYSFTLVLLFVMRENNSMLYIQTECTVC